VITTFSAPVSNNIVLSAYIIKLKKFSKNFIFLIYFIDDIVNRGKIQVNDGQARFIHLCLAIGFLRGR
jgi:hypothetical protein